ncbi:MAG: glycosyltransferase [Isosphaeraceae bacterium]|nr:glycosyltransferase [Isosphaeraceae bacterium]
MPTVSVLTPSFNYAGGYLEDCIKSVLQQSSSVEVQHVIVDDGSTDDSWDVIKALHPTWRRDCVRQENRGQFATLNRALGMATGEWILWLNADDFLLPATLRLAQRTLERVPDAQIIFGDTIFVDGDERFMRLVAQPRFDRRILRGGYNLFHTPSVLWRKDLLPAGQGFDESMKLLGDLDLWLTITAGNVNIVKIDAPMSAFRRHSGQISASERPSDLAELRRIVERHRLRAYARSIASATRASSTLQARFRHAWLKAVDGGWLAEWRLRPYRGVRMDWMNGHWIAAMESDRARITIGRSEGEHGGLHRLRLDA